MRHRSAYLFIHSQHMNDKRKKLTYAHNSLGQPSADTTQEETIVIRAVPSVAAGAVVDIAESLYHRAKPKIV